VRAAVTLLQQELGWLGEHVHARRLSTVFEVVAAVHISRRLSLTPLGRVLGRSIHSKNAVKCVDRLLGNAHLLREVPLFFSALARTLLPQDKRPIILVDWTDVGKGWAALVATLVTGGRGIVIYAQAHPRKRENNPRIESSFLRGLQGILPQGAKPILVTDAGFRGPWLKKVMRLGWDFVARVRGRVQVRTAGSPVWAAVKSLWQMIHATPKDFGMASLARYLPVECRLVAVRKRRRKSRTKRKKLPAIGIRKKRSIRSAWEPWVLATSLYEAPPAKVVELYALRMRIEETFRDAKCPRFGWALDQVRVKIAGRLTVLLLLAALAHYVAVLVGAAAEAAGLHVRFQANTVRTRRVLSLPRLGQLVLAALPAAELVGLLTRPAPLEVVTYSG
jgi:hypothetical protein